MSVWRAWALLNTVKRRGILLAKFLDIGIYPGGPQEHHYRSYSREMETLNAPLTWNTLESLKNTEKLYDFNITMLDIMQDITSSYKMFQTRKSAGADEILP